MPRIESRPELSPYFEEKRTFKGYPHIMPDVIIPQTSKGLEWATGRIEQRIANFQQGYTTSHPEELDSRVSGLFTDMQNAGYWHVLNRIDGHELRPRYGGLKEKELQEARDIRNWTKTTFKPEELQEILEIVTDTALMGVHSDASQPGFKHGHSILYSHLVRKPESIFANLPTPTLIKRLNNGRFWEHLPELNSRGYDEHSDEVSEVLSEFSEDLDPDFFEQGYAIFKRNGGEDGILGPDITRLTPSEIQTYWGFVKTLDQAVYEKKDEKAHEEATRQESYQPSWQRYNTYKAPQDTDARVAHLIRPYLHHIHAKAIDPEAEEVREFNTKSVMEQFSDPVLRKYLEKSDMLRNALADDLQHYLVDHVDLATGILSSIPRPREMAAKLISRTRSAKENHWSMPSKEKQLKGISKVLRQSGISLSNLLDLNDTPLTKPTKK